MYVQQKIPVYEKQSIYRGIYYLCKIRLVLLF
jgi:hypothetical protein